MMKIVCALLLVASAYAAPTTDDCLPDVESGKCYRIHESLVGGFDCIQAEEECKNSGGSLAVFETETDYTNVFFALLSKKPGTMILTGMKYKPGLSMERPSYKSDKGRYTPVGFSPKWFEGHPIKEKGHTEMILIPSRSSKYSGFMNSEDGCRYDLILCQE